MRISPRLIVIDIVKKRNRVLLIMDRLFGENGDLAPDPDDGQIRIDPANEPLSRLIAS